jgi:hypothetical protein
MPVIVKLPSGNWRAQVQRKGPSVIASLPESGIKGIAEYIPSQK